MKTTVTRKKILEDHSDIPQKDTVQHLSCRRYEETHQGGRSSSKNELEVEIAGEGCLSSPETMPGRIRVDEARVPVMAGKDIFPGKRLRDSHMYNIFGLLGRQQRAFRRVCKDESLRIIVRDRNPAALIWEDRGARMKPKDIKIKSVNQIDVAWLGYKESDEGSLVFRRPDPIPTVKPVDVDTHTWQCVQKRYRDRLDEYYRHCHVYFIEFQRMGVTVTENGKEKKLDFCVDRETGAISIGGRRVTGDIDLLHVLNANGSGMTPRRKRKVMKRLSQELNIQHDDILAWHVGDDRDLAIKEDILHSHCLGGQPLLEFSPGKPRAVFLYTTRDSFRNFHDVTNKTRYLGGYKCSVT